MQKVNGVLGYILIVLGLFLAAGVEASSGGAVCVAGAILVAAERVGDHLRTLRRERDA